MNRSIHYGFEMTLESSHHFHIAFAETPVRRLIAYVWITPLLVCPSIGVCLKFELMTHTNAKAKPYTVTCWSVTNI